MFPTMDPTNLLLLIVVSLSAFMAAPTTHITVTGSVFCDVCYNNSFTKDSYFLPGADVHVECKFEPTRNEQIRFSVKRRTNRYGVYRVDIPSVEGVECPSIESFCEARLISSSVRECNVSSVSNTRKEITIKSRSTNLCVYSLSALTYRPIKRNSTMCGSNLTITPEEQEKLLSSSFNSSKFFLPYFPWPQLPPWPSLPPLPQLPPWPSLPPLPQLPPFPSFPPFPPMSPLPSLPPLPPLPQLPPFSPLPHLPSLPPLPPFPTPPPSLIPNIPSSNPPPPTPPLGFFPRIWIPYFPPSPQTNQP